MYSTFRIGTRSESETASNSTTRRKIQTQRQKDQSGPGCDNPLSYGDLSEFVCIPTAQRPYMAQKFATLISSNGKISRVPGMTENACLVSSNSNPRKPHFVDATFKNGKVACDCVNYKTFKVCAHALAGAQFCGVFREYSAWHNQQSTTPRLDAIVEHKRDTSVGLKKTKRTQRRLGTSVPNPSVTKVITPSTSLINVSVPTPGTDRNAVVKPAPYTWELHFLTTYHYKTKTCTGCKKALKHLNADAFSALDLIVVTHMEKTYFDAKEQKEKDAGIGNVYFHLSLDCIRKKVADFEAKELIFPDSVVTKLTLQHKRRIKATMKYNFTFI